MPGVDRRNMCCMGGDASGMCSSKVSHPVALDIGGRAYRLVHLARLLTYMLSAAIDDFFFPATGRSCDP